MIGYKRQKEHKRSTYSRSSGTSSSVVTIRSRGTLKEKEKREGDGMSGKSSLV